MHREVTMAEDVSPEILIIEDDGDARANLADILELDGYRVDMAGTVREVLDRTHWDDYAAVLLDRRLPDGSSEDLVPHIQERAPQAALIILTGYGDIINAIEALRHGVADYLLKPIDAAALRASLDRIRQLRDAEARAQQAERLAAIGQMAAALSHESRNALHQIGLSLSLIKAQVKGGPAGVLGPGRVGREGLEARAPAVRRCPRLCGPDHPSAGELSAPYCGAPGVAHFADALARARRSIPGVRQRPGPLVPCRPLLSGAGLPQSV
jgi:FixJ family two-component response regulator